MSSPSSVTLSDRAAHAVAGSSTASTAVSRPMVGQATPLTLPVSQRSTSWTSHSSTRVKTYWMTDCMAAARPMPARTSRKPPWSPATARTASATPRAPATAAAETGQPVHPARAIADTAAALAPRLTPTMSGLASGLRSVVWKIAPPIPKAVPTSTASTARGSLDSITM